MLGHLECALHYFNLFFFWCKEFRMNLQRLAQGIHTEFTRNNYADALAAARALLPGTTCIGEGAFGTAWVIQDGRVLKIGHSGEDGSAGYISRCAELYLARGKAPNMLPEVYEFHQQGKGGWWWAVMEQVRVNPPGARHAHEVERDFVRMAFPHLGARKHLDDYWTTDIHGGNWGHAVKDGREVVFDPFARGTHLKRYRLHVQAKYWRMQS